MSNDYFNPSGTPVTNARALSASQRSEFTAVGTGFDKLPTPAKLWGQSANQATAGGSADAWTLSLAATYLTSYTDGLKVAVRFAATNATTTPTLNLNSLGARTICYDTGTALGAGDIAANSLIQLIYDATLGKWTIPARPAAATVASLVTFTPAGSGVVTRSVQDKERDIVSVFDYFTTAQKDDVRGSTLLVDVTSATQAAITAAPNVEMWFPKGAYKFTDRITVPINAELTVRGAGRNQTVFFQYDTTKGCFRFSNAYGGGIHDCTLAGVGGAVNAPGSTGIGLHLLANGDGFKVHNLLITKFDTGIQAEGSNGEYVSNCTIRYFTDYGIHFPDAANQLEGRYRDCLITNLGFTTPNSSIGLSVRGNGGTFFSDFDILACNNAVKQWPAASNPQTYCTFRNILADTSISDGWVVDASAAAITGTKMVACWSSYSTGGSGLVTSGSIDDLQWIGGNLRENGRHGWHHQGGSNIAVVGASINRNSKQTTLTYSGVRVNANVSGWSLVGCRIGNFGSSGAWSQLHNVEVAAGTSENFMVTDCDLRSPGAGGSCIALGTSSTNYQIANNLPLQTVGVNISESTYLPFASGQTNPTAGAFWYLGPAGSADTPWKSSYFIGKLGIVTGFIVNVVAAPGAGETFTYTVMFNGVATSMTGTISGAGSFQVIVGSTNSFLVGPTDYVCLRLVTSAAAAVTTHWGRINVEG